jgi:nitrogen fixation protein FixH
MTTLALRRRRSLIPLIFFAAFAVVFAVNGTMIYFAVRSTPALVTEKPFERGKAYNAELDAAAAQARLGWSATVALEQHAAPRSELIILITDRGGAPVEGLAVAARLTRPVGHAAPLDVAFVEIAPGRYVAMVVVPVPGQWQLTLLARRGNDEFTLGHRLTVK